MGKTKSKQPQSRQSISKLKKNVWRNFSKYIRERDKNTCITCGKTGRKDSSGFMHAGHYISRRHQNTLFDEKNVHAQCMNCNLWGYGNMGVYTLKMIDMYGDGIIKELTKKSQQVKQFTPQELKKLGEEYKNKLWKLQKKKSVQIPY
jgi:hypothetical protein